VIASLRELAAGKQVIVQLQAPDRLGLYADAEQVRTALACLLRNAIEAAPAEGWARLRVEAGAERVEVRIEDSGPGPSDEQRGSLFDPFFSGRNAGRGRGLGLPVAWRLAQLQGGDVRLEPAQPGAATCFVLTLPRREAEERSAA